MVNESLQCCGSDPHLLALGLFSGLVGRCRRGQYSAAGNARLGSGETEPCATVSGRNTLSGWRKVKRGHENKLGCSNSLPSTAGWPTIWPVRRRENLESSIPE